MAWNKVDNTSINHEQRGIDILNLNANFPQFFLIFFAISAIFHNLFSMFSLSAIILHELEMEWEMKLNVSQGDPGDFSCCKFFKICHNYDKFWQILAFFI